LLSTAFIDSFTVLGFFRRSARSFVFLPGGLSFAAPLLRWADQRGRFAGQNRGGGGRAGSHATGGPGAGIFARRTGRVPRKRAGFYLKLADGL